MYQVSAERYKNVEVDTKIVRKTVEIWVSMKDFGSGMGAKNISDLALKKLRCVLKKKKPYKRAD